MGRESTRIPAPLAHLRRVQRSEVDQPSDRDGRGNGRIGDVIGVGPEGACEGGCAFGEIALHLRLDVERLATLVAEDSADGPAETPGTQIHGVEEVGVTVEALAFPFRVVGSEVGSPQRDVQAGSDLFVRE